MYKVSVIIPVYNTEKYIERCAVSLFEQTLDDVEYIFINDCSTDNSIKILHNVLNRYPNRKRQVKIIEFERNKGVAIARSEGIKQANGEYIIHCDSDDWVDKSAYKLLYDKAISEDADVVYHSYTFSDGISNIDIRHVTGNGKWNAFTDDIMLWCKLVKRTIFLNKEFVFTDAGMCEDRVYSFQIALYSTKIVFLDKILYYYFVNRNSVCLNRSESACLARFSQVSTNQKHIENLIHRNHLAEKFNRYNFHLKYTAKQQLAPITINPKYYKLWKKTYPEVNFRTILKYEDLRTIIVFITVKFRLYSLFSK